MNIFSTFYSSCIFVQIFFVAAYFCKFECTIFLVQLFILDKLVKIWEYKLKLLWECVVFVQVDKNEIYLAISRYSIRWINKYLWGLIIGCIHLCKQNISYFYWKFFLNIENKDLKAELKLIFLYRCIYDIYDASS